MEPVESKTRNKAAAPKPRRRNRLSIVRSLIEKWAADLEKKPTKTGIAELAKLLTLERELSVKKQDEIREVKVTWVEPKATES